MTEMAAGELVGAQMCLYPEAIHQKDLAESKLQRMMLEACACDVKIEWQDFKFMKPIDQAEPSEVVPIGVGSQGTARGIRCATAMHWKDKADCWRERCIERIPE